MPDDSTTDDGQLRDELAQMRAMVEALQAEVAGLRERAERIAPELVEVDAGETESSRRGLLKLAGGAAVAAVGAGMVLDGARPAAANTGDDLVTGRFNYAQNVTILQNSTGPKTNGAPVGGGLTVEKTLFWVDNSTSSLPNAVGIRADGLDQGAGFEGYGGTGVRGIGTTDGVAGSGPIGVRGTGTKAGVAGTSTNPGGVGVVAIGHRAALSLTGISGAAPPDRTDAHETGEIDVDNLGTTWLCVDRGSPGEWRKLGGPTTAGAFHAIDPVRAFDSRWAGNRLVSLANRVVSVADSHDSAGGIKATGIVPAGATAIAYNLTVTETSGSGYLSVTPGSSAVFVSSSINWSGDGQNLANGLIVAVDESRQIKIFCGGGGSTHYVVDVTGYFR